MSKKRTTEQNRIKATRYRLRKRVADLGKAIEERTECHRIILQVGAKWQMIC